MMMEYCDQLPVCLCVCLSVCKHISETAGPIFTKVVVQIPCGVARSFSGGVAICYVLPVLWMTSRLVVVGRMCVHGLSVAKYSAPGVAGPERSLMSMNK